MSTHNVGFHGEIRKISVIYNRQKLNSEFLEVLIDLAICQ